MNQTLEHRFSNWLQIFNSLRYEAIKIADSAVPRRSDALTHIFGWRCFGNKLLPRGFGSRRNLAKAVQASETNTNWGFLKALRKFIDRQRGTASISQEKKWESPKPEFVAKNELDVSKILPKSFERFELVSKRLYFGRTGLSHHFWSVGPVIRSKPSGSSAQKIQQLWIQINGNSATTTP